MKRIVLILLLLNSVNLVSQNAYRIKEINYGISSAKKIFEEKMKNSPSGYHNITEWDNKILIRTDTIYAVLGSQFGVEYELIGDKDEVTDIQITWIFPKGMKNEKGKSLSEMTYSVPKATNSYTYSNYTLEGKNEVVKGQWIFIVSKSGKELYRKIFYLL